MIKLYIVAGILFLTIAIGFNWWVNKVKSERCTMAGGTLMLNTSDANLTTCIMPALQK